MRPVRLMILRTMGRARVAFTNALATTCFLGVVSGLFAYNLFAAEGLYQTPGLIWCVSVAPILPFLCVFLGMNAWSDEIRSHRIDELLSVAVRERDYVVGKFLGVWLLSLRDLLLSLLLTLGVLYLFNAHLAEDYSLSCFWAGFAMLALQAMLWSAVTVALSARTGSAAVSAISALVLIVLVPRGGWLAALAWAPQGSSRFGTLPLDAHVVDFATGHISVAALSFYILATLFALYACANSIVIKRYAGRANSGLRNSLRGLSISALVVTVLAASFIARFDVVLEFPFQIGRGDRFSARTRHIIGESQGEIRAILFVSRKNPEFRTAAGLLRAFAQASAALGGARIMPRYVDPFWDPAAATRLVNAAVPENSLVLERGSRREIVALGDGFDERACASAIQRLTATPRYRSVYWTAGHGEGRLTDYGDWGLSAIARAVVMEGYRNQTLDLLEDKPIPNDCALIIVAGAHAEFSRQERARLESYLRQGGRLLVLLSSVQGGLASTLPLWGVRPVALKTTQAPTLTGTDRLVSDFGAHAIVSPLKGERLVFDAPIALTSSPAAKHALGAGAVTYTELCRMGKNCRAALVEQGVTASADVAARPARLIVVGDAGFIQNIRLLNSVTANRDFFLNCVAYLAGVDTLAEVNVEANKLIVGLDRTGRARYVLVSAVVVPGFYGLLLAGLVLFRRNRQ